MRRYLIVLLAWLLSVTWLPAHFIWIVPTGPAADKPEVQVIFSDSLKPDSADLLKKIASTRFLAQTSDGRALEVKKTEEGDAFKLTLPDAKCTVIRGACRYGVVKRGSSVPFLLMYYPKAILDQMPRRGEAPRHSDVTSDLTPLEIIPVRDKPGLFQVLLRQQPVYALEVTVQRQSEDKSTTRQLDIDGVFALEDAGKVPAGTYGMRVAYVDSKPGDHEGKAYKEIRHYATLVVRYPQN
jgi:uncharacterized GH25 family protein